MNNYIIYKHLFPNGKVYIGLTSLKASNRFSNGKGYKHNQYMQNAINKYKWENVKHFILFENLTKEEAEQKEIELIKFYNSNNQKYGYNICSGGNGTPNHIVSIETRLKISNAKKGKKYHKMTDETKKKLSLSTKGEKHWNYGGKISEEHKNKLTKSLNKKIIQYSIDGKLIKIWDGIRIAGRALNLDSSGLSKCCNGKYNSYGGFKWEHQKL